MQELNTQRRLHALIQRSAIKDHKMYQRLAYKTQVRFPGWDSGEVVRNRLTHSDEVSISADIMVASFSEQHNVSFETIDYTGSVALSALMHDFGHCFSHDGQRLIHAAFIEMGLPEGFCDNNNIFAVVEKNNIMVSDHTLASLIKYPEKLYPYQKPKYLSILTKAIHDDQEHFKSIGILLEGRSRTVSCDIMDEADRNTYICSDLSDYLCIGNSLPINELKALATQHNLTYRFGELNTLFAIANSGDKSAIKAYFNTIKNRLNQNFSLGNCGITVKDKDLQAYREFLWAVEYKYYIVPNRREKQHHEHLAMLSAYIDKVVKEGFAPSRTYARLIDAEKDPIAKLRLQRDMIAESTDLFITQVYRQGVSACTTPHHEIGLDVQHWERAKLALAQYYQPGVGPADSE